MLQSRASAECPAENINLREVGMPIESIIPIGHIARDVDWKNEKEVIDLLEHRFAVSLLPFKARLELYIKLMTVLSIDGLIFHVETRSDRKKLRRGVKMKTIQSLLLPEMEYREGNC
jgi:hypothetical protein